MSPKAKELIESSIITFLTGFLLVLSTSIDSLTLESFSDGTLVGILGAAVRLGLKLAFQAFVSRSRE